MKTYRSTLLDAGLQTMFQSGYHGASVRDIVACAGVAQGSFTNHFRSKEAFASEVLDLYFQHVQDLVKEALEDKSRSPRQRLLHYLDIISERLAADKFGRGCLIGDFSAEVPGHSDLLRQHVQTLYDTWRQPFVACITEAQAKREINDLIDPQELADFFLNSWEGAILRSKVEQSDAPLTIFKHIMSRTILSKKEG